MKISYIDGQFALSDAPECDLLMAKIIAGFQFNSASATWYGDAEAVDKLRSNSLRLKSGLTITELALARFKEAGNVVLDAVAASRAQDSDMFMPIPAGQELLPFQRAGVAYASKRKRVLIADEMGLGKTVQAIVTTNADPKAHQILVVCPATLKINWKREFSKWTTKFLDFQIVDGTEPVQMTHDVIIINYDVMRAHRAALREINWDTMIVDEAHYLKNKRANRTMEVFGGVKKDKNKKVVDRADPISCKKVILMTGTPLNKPKELWSLIQILDPEGLGSDWFHYAKRYCQAVSWKQMNNGVEQTMWKWDGADNLEELQEIMRSRFMVRRLKADVLKELPAKRRQVIVLEAKPALKKLVAKEMLTYGEYNIKHAALEDLQLPRFEGLSELRKEIAIKKVPYAIDHVLEVLNETPKAVVFAHHHQVIDALVDGLGEALGKQAVVYVDGRVSLNDRQTAVDRFQTEEGCKIFVGGIQAAGVGLTLTAASTVIFVELDWVPGNLSQAEDRLHRIGQKESVLVQHIVLEGSLDERVVEVILAKQAVIDATLDKEKA